MLLVVVEVEVGGDGGVAAAVVILVPLAAGRSTPPVR